MVTHIHMHASLVSLWGKGAQSLGNLPKEQAVPLCSEARKTEIKISKLSCLETRGCLSVPNCLPHEIESARGLSIYGSTRGFIKRLFGTLFWEEVHKPGLA